jgi:hypothetical protein
MCAEVLRRRVNIQNQVESDGEHAPSGRFSNGGKLKNQVNNEQRITGK